MKFLFRIVKEDELPWFVPGKLAKRLLTTAAYCLIGIGCLTFVLQLVYPDKPGDIGFVVMGVIMLVLIPLGWGG